MDLTLKDAAKFLKVSEKTVYRWVKDGQVPFFRLQRQFRFKKTDLELWAKKNRNADSGTILDPAFPMDLIQLLNRGGIHYRIEGDSPEKVIRNCVEASKIPHAIEKEDILDAILERESMMPTTIGNGVAVPHPRTPSLKTTDFEFASICFPDKPLDFNSLSGELVHTVIILVCANTARHLKALAEISFACSNERVLKSLRERALREEILKNISDEIHKFQAYKKSRSSQ